MWAGEEEYLMQNATQVPVVHSVLLDIKMLNQWQQVALGRKKGHIYGRNTNPTIRGF